MRTRRISLRFSGSTAPRGKASACGSRGAFRRGGQSTFSRTEGAERYLIDRGVGAPRPILQDASRPPDVREKPGCFGRSIRRLARSIAEGLLRGPRPGFALAPSVRLLAMTAPENGLAVSFVGSIPLPPRDDGVVFLANSRGRSPCPARDDGARKHLGAVTVTYNHPFSRYQRAVLSIPSVTSTLGS